MALPICIDNLRWLIEAEPSGDDQIGVLLLFAPIVGRYIDQSRDDDPKERAAALTEALRLYRSFADWTELVGECGPLDILRNIQRRIEGIVSST
jgi:hypothetical protein